MSEELATLVKNRLRNTLDTCTRNSLTREDTLTALTCDVLALVEEQRTVAHRCGLPPSTRS